MLKEAKWRLGHLFRHSCTSKVIFKVCCWLISEWPWPIPKQRKQLWSPWFSFKCRSLYFITFLLALSKKSFYLEEIKLVFLFCAASGHDGRRIKKYKGPLPATEATKYMFSKAFLTWPLAGSSLQLLHWLLLVQEALKEWESSIELKGNFF